MHDQIKSRNQVVRQKLMECLLLIMATYPIEMLDFHLEIIESILA